MTLMLAVPEAVLSGSIGERVKFNVSSAFLLRGGEGESLRREGHKQKGKKGGKRQD
jgi:hypothetical protein